ncbi:MAG: PD40 domain-containing protein [Anaerolineae bacterium]|nr:PD40 domain-containing protein [Anaerolineae bacterium]
MNNIAELENRYQRLYGDFQAGKIDEAVFIAEVDKLQFQDGRGRYWMMGAQSGAWHYYDGQTWHQADPRDADNLPFVDEQGRYWQRGAKSGDWYYYNPETKEWVKPSPTGDSRPTPIVGRGEGQNRWADTGSIPAQSQPYQSHLYPQSADNGPQFDGELFQDDEGRYWAIGTKTGQWYFYDHAGWHPAQEFQPGGTQYQQQSQSYQPYYSQSPQTPYQAQQPWGASAYGAPPYQAQGPQAYAYPPQQPAYQQPAPGPTYNPPPGQEAQSGQPAQGYAGPFQSQPAPAPTGDAGPTPMPAPPGGGSQSGSWFYFDGKQWLKYASGEPAETPPPDPKMVIDQESKAASEPKAAAAEPKAKDEPKGQAVVAELFESDEPPVEVVDVEVITVLEAEPDEDEEPAAKPVKAASKAKEPVSAPPLADVDDIKPRRPRQPSDSMRARPAPGEPQQQFRDRIPTDPGRPVAPRRRESAYEPTIIIPTGAAASPRASRPVPVQQQQPRRARENTLPMEPVPAQSGAARPTPDRQAVTQPLPVASRVQRAETGPMRAPAVAKEPTQPNPLAAPIPASQAAASAQPKTSGHTFGDVLRAFPSTVWTFTGGLIVLVIFAAVIIGAYLLLNGNNPSVGGVAVVQSPTPTLDAGPPDATPTLGPTPTTSPEPVTTPTPAEMTTFSSSALGFTLDYPEDWQKKEADEQVVFSPSKDGLDPANLKDTALWIGIPTSNKSAIADLLTDALSGFPGDAETLNEGTISIASQTWTSTQIRYKDDNLGGQGIATIAVTSKDDTGYYLVAAAPAEKWNSTQPVFQEMINSFRFSKKGTALAQAPADKTPSSSSAITATAEITGTVTAAKATTPAATTSAGGAKATAVPKSTPTPKATATPLVYAVQSGDTLLEISLKFGVNVDELAAKNDITDPGKLSLGQELIIPFTAEQLEAYNSGGNPAPAANSSASAQSESAAASAAITTTTTVTNTSTQAEAAAPPAAQATKPASSGAAAAVSGRIVYAAFNPGTNTFDLWLADVATGEQTGIASSASQPAFNKDGSLLAYRSWQIDTRGIFFRDFIGGRGGQVTRFVEDGLPTWAPDGISFAFATRREGDRVPRIYRGDQLGKGDFSIGFQGEYPATLPDGRLVVRGCLPSGDCGIFIVGPNGGGETKISSERSDTAPSPSPDGSKIAFMSSGRGGTNWEIWVMDASGSNPRRLTDNGNNDGLPTWSPDGKSIAYVSDAGGAWAIWVMNADGSNQRKLFDMKGTPDGYVLLDKDNSKGWLEERISWAP